MAVFSHTGIFIIYIYLSRSKVKETILHELAHIELNQIDRDLKALKK